MKRRDRLGMWKELKVMKPPFAPEITVARSSPPGAFTHHGGHANRVLHKFVWEVSIIGIPPIGSPHAEPVPRRCLAALEKRS